MHLKQPIGIFDSGLGGLSVAKEIHALLPGEDILFLADQANLPYGEKSQAEIERLAQAAVPTLLAEGAKLVVIACNSASVSIIEKLRLRYPETPFVAVVPMIKPAAEASATGTIAVFATETTLKSTMYADLKHRFAKDTVVLDVPAPQWVGMVESGQFAAKFVEKPVADAIHRGADQVVLGCTHYPFLRTLIEPAAEGKAAVLDSGAAVARQVERILAANENRATGGSGETRYLTSGPPEQPSLVASKILNRPVRFRAVGH